MNVCRWHTMCAESICWNSVLSQTKIINDISVKPVGSISCLLLRLIKQVLNGSSKSWSLHISFNSTKTCIICLCRSQLPISILIYIWMCVLCFCVGHMMAVSCPYQDKAVTEYVEKDKCVQLYWTEKNAPAISFFSHIGNILDVWNDRMLKIKLHILLQAGD